MTRKRLLIAATALFLSLPTVALPVVIHLESQDSFCASCHTQPEFDYYLRSLSPPEDLASAHAAADLSVRCIDCHSGEGLPGRGHSLVQGASDLLAYIRWNFEQPAVTTNPVGDIGCIKCHIPSSLGVSSGQENGLLSKSHYHLPAYAAEWRAREPDPRGTCTVCHVAHTQGTLAAQSYLPNPAVKLACDACHLSLSGWVPQSD